MPISFSSSFSFCSPLFGYLLFQNFQTFAMINDRRRRLPCTRVDFRILSGPCVCKMILAKTIASISLSIPPDVMLCYVMLTTDEDDNLFIQSKSLLNARQKSCDIFFSFFDRLDRMMMNRSIRFNTKGLLWLTTLRYLSNQRGKKKALSLNLKKREI